MKQPPIGGDRIRYDHQRTGLLDELQKLDDLIKFLDTVGPNARLRAKEENGMKFLHTRTGSHLGRFLKWTTIAWPEARRQRELAKAFVGETLRDIGAADKYGHSVAKLIKSYKEEILNTTLKVRAFKEFDIADLKNKLTELKKLASTASIAQPARTADTVTAQNSSPDDEEASTSPVSTVSMEMPVLHEYENLELPVNPMLAVQKLGVPADQKLAESIRPPASQYGDIKPPLQPQRLRPVSEAPAGKLEIFGKAHSGSRYALISLLNADAYVLPSDKGSQNPNQKLLVEAAQTTASSVTAFHGKLADDASSRGWGLLVMDAPASTLSLTEEEKADALYAQYLKTLEEAVAMRIGADQPVRNIAIRPWKDRLLSDVAAQTLIRAVNRFREKHPETHILIVPSAMGEERKLQAALEQVGKDSASPFASVSS